MLITKIEAIKKEVASKRANTTIGLVPTMGYLHDGHISLIKRARQENDIVVLSIFVNPTQFSPSEDFEQYPRDMDRDIRIAYENEVDYIFAPAVSEIYPPNYSTFISIEGPMTQGLCGVSRPTHFRGVAAIVAKLFNIIRPSSAYFGQKDAQQLSIIKKLVKDLNFDINIVACPTIREADGLALSSRNVYLTEQERKQATVLFQSLKDTEAMFVNGNKDAVKLKHHIVNQISTKELAKIDYVEIVDIETLEKMNVVEKTAIVAMAVRFGSTRLIDNIILKP